MALRLPWYEFGESQMGHDDDNKEWEVGGGRSKT